MLHSKRLEALLGPVLVKEEKLVHREGGWTLQQGPREVVPPLSLESLEV